MYDAHLVYDALYLVGLEMPYKVPRKRGPYLRLLGYYLLDLVLSYVRNSGSGCGIYLFRAVELADGYQSYVRSLPSAAAAARRGAAGR